MQILCAQCQSPIDVTHIGRDTEVSCPACGSSFALEGESTIDWRPRAEQMVGRFKLLNFVGQGAFGMVYKAHDTHLERTVAVKIPRAPQVGDSPDRDRFLREARSVARLRHPSILPIHEVGQHEYTPYLVTEFLTGVTLMDLLTTRRPPFREAAGIVATIAEALHYAHSQGVIHRDVKPSNIMLDEQGRAFLMDFGLARRDTGDASITVDGQVMGTPAYMSPEQARGEGHRADGRSDVYSLGAVLYQLLTGERPFRGNTRMLLHQVLNDEPRPPRSLNDHIPRDLETITLKAMAKAPERRYQTAGDFAADLRRFLAGEPILARPAGRLERAARWLRRNPLPSALAGVTALALVALAVAAVSVAFSRRLQTAYDHEAAERARAEQAELEARQAEGVATRAKGEAEKALGLTRQAQGETQRALGLAKTHEYFHRIALADAALRESNVERARGLLDGCPEGLRHWEWRHLMQQCNAPLASYPLRAVGGVHRVRVSPDGKYLACRHGDFTLSVHDPETGQAIWTKKGGPEVRGVGLAISPDSRTIATGGPLGSVLLLRLADGKPEREVPAAADAGPGRIGNPVALAFSPDGKKLAAGWVGEMALIDVAKGEYERAYRGNFGRLEDLSFHPDGKSFATAHWSGASVLIWEVDSDRPRLALETGQAAMYTASYNPRGTLLATGGLSGDVRVWLAAAGRPFATIPAHEATTRRVVFRPDGMALASCSSDGTVQVHAMPQGQRLATYRGHRGHVFDVAFHPEGDRLFSVGIDGTLKVWDATTAHAGRVTQGVSGGVNIVKARFLPGGKEFVTAGLDEALQVRDTATLETVRTLRSVPRVGSTITDKAVAIHPGGKKVASRLAGVPLQVFDLTTGKVLLTVDEVLGNWPAVYTPDGKSLLTANRDGTIDVRDADTGNTSRSLKGHKGEVLSLAVSPDGRWLASSSGAGELLLWDLPKGTVTHRLTGRAKLRSTAPPLAFSHDSGTLASGTDEGKIFLWNVADGKAKMTLAGHLGDVHDLKFHPEGKRLLSGGMDFRARLWDLATGEEALTLRGPGNQVQSVDFDEKGERILLASGDQMLFVLDSEEVTPAWQEARRARQKEQVRLWQRRQLERAVRLRVWHSAEWLATRLIDAKNGLASDYAARGQARAEIGRRAEARADLAQAWKDRDCPLRVGSLLALLHHEAADAAAHKAVVAEMLRRAAATKSPVAANNAAWAAARFPAAVDDYKPVKALAEMAAGPEGRRSPIGLNTLGAVLYRAGDPKGGIAAIEEGMRLGQSGGQLEDWVFLAMAHHKLGQKEDAAAWMVKAQDHFKKRQALRKGDGQTPPLADLELALLVREMVATLKEVKPDKKP